MTFSTGGKKGKQSKAISITSNDPKNPTTKVHVTALIEIEFGFENRGLNVGKIDLNEPVSKSAFVVIKDPANTQITELTSTSPLITPQAVGSEDGDGSRIEVEITMMPGIPPGKFNETIKASSNREDLPETSLRVSGTVLGDIELEPDNLRFMYYQSKVDKSTLTQEFQIVNRSESTPLNVLSIKDPDGRLQLEIITLQEGQKYAVTANLKKEVISEGNYFKGSIVIETDNQRQKTIKEDYTIFNRK